MSASDSDDQDHEEPPPGFRRNANDATDIKHLRIMDGQKLQDNYEDLSSFFNYYGNLFISVETDEAAYDMMYTHPILLPVLKQFQIQEAYNNNNRSLKTTTRQRNTPNGAFPRRSSTLTRLVSDAITHFACPVT